MHKNFQKLVDFEIFNNLGNVETRLFFYKNDANLERKFSNLFGKANLKISEIKTQVWKGDERVCKTIEVFLAKKKIGMTNQK